MCWFGVCLGDLVLVVVGYCIEQVVCVFFMWCCDQFGCGCLFDDVVVLYDQYFVGDEFYDCQVVVDEDVVQVEFVL